MRHEGGFTLIELMIVIVIIGVLAGLALPIYQNYATRAQVSEGLYLVSEAKAAEWDFITRTGRYPPSNQSAGLPSPTSIAGNYVTQVAVNAGSIRVRYGNHVNAAVTGDILLLSPTTTTGSIKWHCYSAHMPVQYLPSACR